MTLTQLLSIGGRNLCNLRFADDFDLMFGTETRPDYETRDSFKTVRNGN